jgi:hypothetical protein
MSFIKDIVENPHVIYRTNIDYWGFLLQSYEGGRAYCNADLPGAKSDSSLLNRLFQVFVNGREVQQNIISGNLFRHPKERNDDYNDRIRMSYYYNFCSPIIDIYTNHLFKDAVMEDFGSIKSMIDVIRDDVDNQESSIDEFRHALAEMAQVYGHCFVLVDSPSIPAEEVRSRQEQINERAFPYAAIYPPQNVINWSLDKFGVPYWILVRESADTNIDPLKYDPKAQEDWTYKLWTRTGWYQFNRKYEQIGAGVHGLGMVPLACIYSKRSKTSISFLGVSDLADIAFIARDIYNSCSELKQILRDQTFAFLAIQGDTSEYNELSVGVSKALLYPENRNAPQYVSPASDNAEVYFNHIDRQVKKIYQLAKLEGGSAQQEQTAIVQSGVSKAWDFNETNSTLAKKASNIEDGEIKIWRIFAAWAAQEFDGTITYPNEFSIQGLNDDLDEAQKEFRLSLGDTFDLEVRKAIHKKKFPRATEEDLKKMAEEAQTKAKEFNNQNGNGNGGAGLSVRERMPFLFKQNVNSTAKGGQE